MSQSDSPVSVTKTSRDSKNVENLNTFSSVRRPKSNGVIWKKKWSSNTSNVDLSYVNHSKLKKDVKLCDSFDENNLFIFDDIIQIYLWIIDLGCSKHMTGNRALLTNFVKKFLGMVRFGNNDLAVIAGYGDMVIGSMTIKKVYYVEGLGHNLFSVRQFCDKGLEVAFRKSTCFVRNEDGVDLLTGDRSSNLYTISLNEVAPNSSTCLLTKASSSQSWLWHQHEASDVIISFIKKTQVNLQLQVQHVRTDNGTEFKNKTLAKFFDEIQVAQKKVKIAFENADSSLRVELIPSKIKYANKVVINFHKEFSVFSSFKGKGNDEILQNKVFKA
uniref:Integrase, catalytic region, zinc finger, CCHC-type, peptidase aspartic, catalytic n=1 Tax=Tanacetum cinerariifolium TaxID=118510 RepID=A0A6L2L8M1_TANCI|nr:integrase, catalytic region, zinc finger, CCHC-type, peptidase aspartic, catalytic [Tanacetum cinerariifolium]